MPASDGISGTASPIDTTAIATYLQINGSNMGPKTYVQKVTYRWGIEASTAECVVPLSALDSIVPAISGVDSSPVYAIKQGDLATTFAGPVTMLCGTVTSIHPDIGLDKAIITVKDFRHQLDGVQIIGSWWGRIPATGVTPGVDYREGVKAHFNPRMQPNCIWVDANGNKTPVFCPAGYGLTDFTGSEPAGSFAAVTVPDPWDISTTQACYWIPETLLMYLQFITSSAAGALVPVRFPWYPDACCINESFVSFPPLLFTGMADSSETSRKNFERVYHCVNLNHVIDDVLKASGPYALFMFPEQDGTNTMQIVRTRYSGNDPSHSFASGAGPSANATKGTDITRAEGDKYANDVGGPVLNGGSIKESGDNLFTKVIVVGEHAAIECRCDSYLTWNAAYNGTSVPLNWSWSELDRLNAKALFLKAINTNPSPIGIQDALRGICRAIPALFCEYIVNPGFDFQAGTTQAGFPIATTNREILPHLLSSYVPSNAGDQFARLNSRYPIPLETSLKSDDSAWQILPDANGLQIRGRGIFSLRLQRDVDIEGCSTSAGAGFSGNVNSQAKTFDIQVTGTYPNYSILTDADGEHFRPVRIRTSLALPCDHRLTAALKIACDPADNVTVASPVDSDDNDRINTIAGGRTLAIDTGALYGYEERGGTYGAYPIPGSLLNPNGSAGYPMAGAQTADALALFGPATIVRNDTKYVLEHALKRIREVGRLDRGGTIRTDRIELTALPGQFHKEIGNTNDNPFPIPSAVKQVELNFMSAPQYTERQLV